jgi:outer membrane receptor protein involved in Fe transport
LKYPDSLANAAFDGAQISQWQRRYRGPDPYFTGQGFQFNAPGTPVNSYFTNQQRSMELSGDFVSQMSKSWEVKVGGRLESWNMRQYNITNIAGGLELLYGLNGNTPATFPDEETRRVQWARQAAVNNYGYDVYGNKVDGGVTDQDAPKKPLFYSAYWQNKVEFRDLVLNLGLRYEGFNPRGRAFNDPTNIDFDENLDVIDETSLTEGPSYNYLLPRVNFSFPVTDKTVFYAAYGKYVQMPSLNNIYVGFVTLSRTVSPVSAGNAFLTPIGFLSEPERLTQYEVGFRQQLGEVAAFTLRADAGFAPHQAAFRPLQFDAARRPRYRLQSAIFFWRGGDTDLRPFPRLHQPAGVQPTIAWHDVARLSLRQRRWRQHSAGLGRFCVV